MFGFLVQAVLRFTEVHFASFLSSGFITAIVVNTPERKLAKRTSVQCVKSMQIWIGFYALTRQKRLAVLLRVAATQAYIAVAALV